METKLHFSRFEFKYILNKSIRDDLERELQYFIELDPYVAEQPGKKYFVRSLYYDNAPMVCYYEKIDGVMRRAKFRLRTYTDDADAGVARFLEIKGKHNALVFKHRSELAEEPLGQELLGGPVPALDPITREVLDRLGAGELKTRFLQEIYRKRLKPVMLIDYRRRPYLSKYDPEFRLTFDDSLSCTATGELFPRPHAGRRRILPGYSVLEVKFRFHVPKWFHRIIQGFELRRVSISKYCAGVEAYHLAPKLE